MPGVNINFSEVEDAGTLKPGRYLAQVLEVDDGRRTKNGDDMWTLQFRLIEGPEGQPYPGQMLEKFPFADNIVWSANPNALKRAKLVCRAFGIDVDRKEEVEIQPDMIRGRPVYLDLMVERSTYQGEERERNTVKFAGYHPVPDDLAEAVEKDGSTDDIPF
jgi:hypothetical protein